MVPVTTNQDDLHKDFAEKSEKISPMGSTDPTCCFPTFGIHKDLVLIMSPYDPNGYGDIVIWWYGWLMLVMSFWFFSATSDPSFSSPLDQKIKKKIQPFSPVKSSEISMKKWPITVAPVRLSGHDPQVGGPPCPDALRHLGVFSGSREGFNGVKWLEAGRKMHGGDHQVRRSRNLVTALRTNPFGNPGCQCGYQSWKKRACEGVNFLKGLWYYGVHIFPPKSSSFWALTAIKPFKKVMCHHA